VLVLQKPHKLLIIKLFFKIAFHLKGEKHLPFLQDPIIILAPPLAYAVKAKPYGWPSASLDLTRYGAIFFLKPEGKRKFSFFLSPCDFPFLPEPRAVKGKPAGRSLRLKAQVGASVASGDP